MKNKNTDPNLYYNGSTILYDAVKHNNTDIIKILLSNENIDVNEGHYLNEKEIFKSIYLNGVRNQINNKIIQ